MEAIVDGFGWILTNSNGMNGEYVSNLTTSVVNLKQLCLFLFLNTIQQQPITIHNSAITRDNFTNNYVSSAINARQLQRRKPHLLSAVVYNEHYIIQHMLRHPGASSALELTQISSVAIYNSSKGYTGDVIVAADFHCMKTGTAA